MTTMQNAAPKVGTASTSSGMLADQVTSGAGLPTLRDPLPGDLTALSDAELEALCLDLYCDAVDAPKKPIRSHWRQHLPGMPDSWVHEWIECNSEGFDSGHPVGYAKATYEQGRIQFELGRRRGVTQERARVAAEHSAYLDAHNRQLVADLTSQPGFPTLSQRRGEHDRAARARQILRERGIA